MAKPKGKDIVGWGSTSAAASYEIIGERDVNQTKNRKAGLGSTWSKGHIVRQLGLAAIKIPKGKVYFLYTHSQVSNRWSHEPAGYVGMTRNDLEWLAQQILQELMRDPE